jgi:hypothetical protein
MTIYAFLNIFSFSGKGVCFEKEYKNTATVGIIYPSYREFSNGKNGKNISVVRICP